MAVVAWLLMFVEIVGAWELRRRVIDTFIYSIMCILHQSRIPEFSRYVLRPQSLALRYRLDPLFPQATTYRHSHDIAGNRSATELVGGVATGRNEGELRRLPNHTTW